jgi:TFIIF-interacting CTD phosphatase-like protein
MNSIINNKKLNFILDLDETLISAEATEDYDFEKYKTKAKKFKFEPMEDYYIIFERPYLQEFLNFLFENFNVSVWTAASKDYALFIIEKIILKDHPERKIDYIFFSYHCNVSKKLKNGTKDLSMLWDICKMQGYNKNNTIILDDYDEVYDTQNNNCIIAEPFKFVENNSENDNFFKNLIPKIQKHVLSKKRLNVKKINVN